MFTSNVPVTQSEAGEMLEFFSAKKSQLINAHKDVFKKLNEYDTMIEKLSNVIKSDVLKYPKGGSWNQRIKYVLTVNPAGLTSRQIVDSIADIEGIEKKSDKWKDIYKGVAPSLSSGDKIYGKDLNKEGNTVYTLLSLI